MKTRKLLSPANNDAAATGDTTLAKKVNKKSKLPIKDNDFGNLCTKVGDKWKTLPSLTLMFITQGQFETKAVSFNTCLLYTSRCV